MLNMIMKIMRFNLHIKMVIFYHIIWLIQRIFFKIKNIYHEKKIAIKPVGCTKNRQTIAQQENAVDQTWKCSIR